MIVWSIFAAMAATSPAAPAPTAAAAAAAIIERDWVLHQWAVKRFDANGDGRVDAAEATAAASELRAIADADSDGRVTPSEYRAAREFILARY